MENSGLVFIKPHAATEKTIQFVIEFLKERHINIEDSGTLSGTEIDTKGIVDRHYFSISNTAMKSDPGSLTLHDDIQKTFLEKFGTEWNKAVKENSVYNSSQYMKTCGITSGKELTEIWTQGEFMKLGPGLYVCRVKDSDKFLINGFYPGMREKFTAPGARIIWYTVRFDPRQLSWKEFRTDVIGATDPAKAAKDSLRSTLYTEYSDFGISSRPSMSDNGVHASAGPIEGMREQLVWAGIDPKESTLGKKLLAQGWTGDKFTSLLENGEAEFNGERGPVFDITEDCDAETVLKGLK